MKTNNPVGTKTVLMMVKIRPEDATEFKVAAARQGMTYGNYIPYLMNKVTKLEKKVVDDLTETE